MPENSVMIRWLINAPSGRPVFLAVAKLPALRSTRKTTMHLLATDRRLSWQCNRLTVLLTINRRRCRSITQSDCPASQTNHIVTSGYFSEQSFSTFSDCLIEITFDRTTSPNCTDTSFLCARQNPYELSFFLTVS